MKKKLFFLLTAVVASLQISAVTIPVHLQDEPDITHGKPQKGPDIIPSVTFDDETNVLELSSLFVIGQATMTIRDADGNVLTTSTFYFGSSQTFPLSDTLVADMYSIELFYDNRHLIGYFDFGEED